MRRLQGLKTTINIFDDMNNNLSELFNCKDNIILLGGYKGLLHSIKLNKDYGDFFKKINNSIFMDIETNLPHGLAKISLF